MTELWDECSARVLLRAAVTGREDLARRHLQLLRPFIDLLSGQAWLVPAKSAPQTVRPTYLARLAGLPEDKPIPVVAVPWSRRRSLPVAEDDYRAYFSTVYTPETCTAITQYGHDVYLQSQAHFMRIAGDSIMDNVLNSQEHGGLDSFEPAVTAAIANGFLSVGALGLLYAWYHDEAGMVRLAYYARFQAQVVPVGIRMGAKALTVISG